MPSSPRRTPYDETLGIYSIGPKLKTLRLEKGLTLSRLGVETKLSTALLSKLESSPMIPTLPTLAKICRVYGVDLGHFFCGVTHHSVSITRNAHLLDNRREQPTAKQIPLHHSDRRSGQTAKVIDLPSGATLNVTAADGNTSCMPNNAIDLLVRPGSASSMGSSGARARSKSIARTSRLFGFGGYGRTPDALRVPLVQGLAIINHHLVRPISELRNVKPVIPA